MARLAPLPIDDVLPELLEGLAARPNAVVVAPPGSGKTTRVPPALLDAGLAEGPEPRRILVLQPRRVAARLAAKRIAWERGEALGEAIGYSTRFERKVSGRTRIEVLTEGLVLRRLQADPFLESVAVVVLDELHERSLDLDLVLALLREVQREGRDDLRIVAMSATLDPGPVAAFLGGPASCTVVEAAGRTFPVQLEFDPRPSERPLHERVASAVRTGLAAEPEGHVLVFLPSVAAIGQAREALARGDLPHGVRVLPLHGSLPARAQDEALAPSKQRKVVLSTNIAETSVTFDGVRRVVDSGLAVVPRFDAATGASSLERQRIARDSADQRSGRAGRTGPGTCHRLWTEAEDRQLAPATSPAVRRSDLAPALLQLASWGVRAEDFGWFEAPPPGALGQADALLRSLGAIDDGGITALGRRLAELPTHPRLGRVLLEAERRDVLASAATAAALADGRDILHRDSPAEPDDDDLSVRLRLVALAESGGRPPRGVRAGALGELRRVRDQLIRLVERLDSAGLDGASGAPIEGPDTPPLVGALLAGFPDRVALQRGASTDRYQLAAGQGARLGRESAARGERLVLALGLDGGRKGARSESWIRLAVALREEWLPSEEQDELVFDTEQEAVVARRVRRFGSLVLTERPSRSRADPLEQAQLLEEAARARGAGILLSLDAEAESLLGRVATLRAQRPELELPDLGDLEALLPSLCTGRRSFAQLRKAPVKPAVLELLRWPQRQALDSDVPERLTVPSGRAVRLQYSRSGGPPILAARIQQLFGMLETPRLVRGQLPVLVHLLAPNGRPAQVTQDLASFWTNTWPAVRKDLRGRYPKHSWPEDPSDAVPENRPRRKKR